MSYISTIHWTTCGLGSRTERSVRAVAPQRAAGATPNAARQASEIPYEAAW